MTTPTPEQNTEAIAQLTQTVQQLSSAVDVLVSQFIRPNAQQAFSNFERLERLEGIVLSIAEQQQANTTAIAANVEAGEAFDVRLQETRGLVAENASGIAQLTVKQDRNAEAIGQLEATQTANAQMIAANAEGISQLRADGADRLAEIEALKELSRTQLAGIIGNGRRIDRLEQQAS